MGIEPVYILIAGGMLYHLRYTDSDGEGMLQRVLVCGDTKWIEFIIRRYLESADPLQQYSYHYEIVLVIVTLLLSI